MIQDQDLELPRESTHASGTHILDLNFDCLHEMFSLECFSSWDLCSIAESHPRLKDVVHYVFAKRYKNYKVDLREITDLETIKRILNNFGTFMAQLSISGDPDFFDRDQKLIQLLDLVIEYCSNTLESLQLNDATISETQTIEMQQFFGQLRKISLKGCRIFSGQTIFSNCESLLELDLEDVYFKDGHLALENTFPKLDRLRYCYYRCGTALWWYCSNDFFTRHQNLKSVILNAIYDLSHLVPGIADNCKQIVELDIELDFDVDDDDIKFEKALTSILTLEHLNKLKMFCDNQNIMNFIAKLKGLKSLKILSLSSAVGDSEFISTLAKLTRLEELQLLSCRGLTNLNPLADLEQLTQLKIASSEELDFDLVRMIKRLINLKTLRLEVRSFKLDEEMYLKIIDVVRERPSKSPLQISCYIAGDGCANSFGDEACRKLVRIIKVYK